MLFMHNVGEPVVQPLTARNLRQAAALMVRLRPDWWDMEGALGQLDSGTGWALLNNDGRVAGWLLANLFSGYRTLQIECLGYDQGGILVINDQLRPLLIASEEWAKGQDCVNIRFISGSAGTSCHGMVIERPWEVLRDFASLENETIEWFMSMGYSPSGLLPDIYGRGCHGIMLIKRLWTGQR